MPKAIFYLLKGDYTFKTLVIMLYFRKFGQYVGRESLSFLERAHVFARLSSNILSNPKKVVQKPKLGGNSQLPDACHHLTHPVLAADVL